MRTTIARVERPQTASRRGHGRGGYQQGTRGTRGRHYKRPRQMGRGRRQVLRMRIWRPVCQVRMARGGGVKPGSQVGHLPGRAEKLQKFLSATG
jgi:hypothetical protein